LLPEPGNPIPVGDFASPAASPDSGANSKEEKPMSHNVGGIERTIRILIGVGLFAVAFFHVVAGTLAVVAYIVGAIAVLTALIGFCPAWAIFGINTCGTKHVASASK
jgi:Inner membrane protein YgaP-like, transmembrane domain